MTLSELRKRWGEHLLVLRGMSKKSVAAYDNYILEFFDWYRREAGKIQGKAAGAVAGGSDLVKRTSRQDIERYLEHLFYDLQNSNSTRKVKLITLRSFFRWLMYEGHIPADVTAGIPAPIVRTRLIQSFTQEEVLRMFRKVDIYSGMGLRDNCILILLAFAGLRVGELCGLRMEDLVDDGDYIHIQIPEDIGKKGSTRVVDLWKAPSVFVRQWMSLRVSYGAGVGSPVFVSFQKGDKIAGNPLTPRSIDRLVKKYAVAAKVRKPRITSHMFRATHASDLRYIKGYDIAAIAERLGHKNISTTDRYLPRRGRLKKEHRSLREYWLEWEKIWVGDSYAEK